jgi:hypothetical protein
MDLLVELTELPPRAAIASAADPVLPLLICARCHNVEEVVVAILKIVELDGTFALCGPCSQELPPGFNVV